MMDGKRRINTPCPAGDFCSLFGQRGMEFGRVGTQLHFKFGAFCFGRLGGIRGKAHLSTVPGVFFLHLFPIAMQTSTLLIDSLGDVCPYWKSVANKGVGYN
jgi:hypothetical protein